MCCTKSDWKDYFRVVLSGIDHEWALRPNILKREKTITEKSDVSITAPSPIKCAKDEKNPRAWARPFTAEQH